VCLSAKANAMVTRKLTPGATLEDVLPTLWNADKYLSGMLANMVLCKREHGSARVRIGVAGDGVAPHYRVEPGESMVAAIMSALSEGKEDDLARYFVAYHGRSHNKLKWGKEELISSRNWSVSRASSDDVQELLGKIRGYKPKRK
jgi:hypothetical protein